MRIIPTLALAAALALPALPALPQATEQSTYSLTIRGISAGTLRLSGRVDGGRYAANGTLQSGGLVGVLRTLRYDAATQGRVSGERFTPDNYSERADNNGRKRQGTMEYRAGVPQVKEYDPPRRADEDDVDAATQGGTVDPLTALFATLRDVQPGAECGRSVRIFDGRRATEVALSRPTRQGDGVICAGEFRRVAGYSERDMAEKRVFPFTLRYDPAPNGMMRVTRITTDTPYGQARLTRR